MLRIFLHSSQSVEFASCPSLCRLVIHYLFIGAQRLILVNSRSGAGISGACVFHLFLVFAVELWSYQWVDFRSLQAADPGLIFLTPNTVHLTAKPCSPQDALEVE